MNGRFSNAEKPVIPTGHVAPLGTKLTRDLIAERQAKKDQARLEAAYTVIGSVFLGLLIAAYYLGKYEVLG